MAATHVNVAHRQAPLKKARRVIGFLLRTALYVALCVIFLVPFVWMIFGSVRAEREIFQYLTPLSIKTFVPIEWTLDSYLTILGLNEIGQATGYAFGHALFNSFVVSIGVVISSLIFNTMGAYFFARLPFPKKNWLVLDMLATFLIPFEATMVPLYIVVRNLHIENSSWELIVPWYASQYVIFSLMQFMPQLMPNGLDEAALMDGASYGTSLCRIIVPSAIRGLVTQALLEFQFIWNLFYWPLIAVGDRKYQVLQVVI